MHAHVTLSVVEGLRRETFDLSNGSQYVAGRSRDCDILLAGEGAGGISRHHCLFSVEDDSVCVTDLGSRNGTYVNGECIGRRNVEHPMQETVGEGDFIEYHLSHGDEIQIGQLLLKVGIAEPSDKYGSLVSAAH